MQIFLDKFDEKRHKALTQHVELEENISSLLLRIAVLASRTAAALPNAQGFSDLKGDLEFKKKEMNNSANTMDALVQGSLY
jgi:intraflagellar transport protein 74